MIGKLQIGRNWPMSLALAAALMVPGTALAQTGSEILMATGVQTGLAVHLGCGDGKLTSQLANEGKMLVHGLALTDEDAQAARKNLQTEGKYGLVSIERGYSWDPLPYADNLVNLVVADLDALGAKAPAQAEVMRIVAPLGAAYIKKGGSWSKVAKPFPKEMDEWTHWDHGPDGNAISQDVAVKPALHLQWINGLQGTHGAPADIGKSNGFRIQGGKVFHSYRYAPSKSNIKQGFYVGRDGFNGLYLWRTPNPNAEKNVFIATPKALIAMMGKQPAYLSALDPATGQVLLTYDKGLKFSLGDAPLYIRPRMNAVFHGGALIMASGPDLVVLDAATGAVKWKYADSNPFLNLPTVATDEGRLFVTAGTKTMGYARQGLVPDVKAILAFDLATGNKLWSHDMSGYDPDKGGNAVSQMISVKGAIYLYTGEDALKSTLPKKAPVLPIMARLNAADGKLVWKVSPNQSGPSGTTSSRTLIVRDDKLYDMLNWRYHEYDAKTGVETKPPVPAGWNRSHTWAGYGCEYQRATPNYMIISGGYVTWDEQVNRQFISRSTCATGFFPGNGMLYSEDGGCKCWAMLRGEVAMASDPLLPPVDDKNRLEKGGLGAEAGANPQGAKMPVGPVTSDWLFNRHYNIDTVAGEARGEVVPRPTWQASGEGLTFIAHIHQQNLEARNGAQTVWNFTGAGRLAVAPVIHDGKVYLGSRDGWLYCLNAKDGKLLWRFLAAGRDQKMVAFGQVESRWPVMGVAIHNGKVAVSAGWHPEMGGGIYVWGLEPASGAVAWKVNLYSPRQFQSAKEAGGAHSNKMLNGKLASVGDQLQILGTNEVREYAYLMDPVAWNGKSIDPKTQGTVRIRSFRSISEMEASRTPFPVLAVRGGRLEVDLMDKANQDGGQGSRFTLRLYDGRGKEVWRKDLNFSASQGRVVLELPTLGRGTYKAVLSAPRHSVSHKLSL